ncbi:hypothetical protein AGR4A_Cc40037 [Agrobacterium tumefaciens str. B6]|uniref:Uncharacterized protein n=1 Tax=Agrobacterium tumefaciens str. B6 TaxID=1183423 RepID=A0A822V2S3_AGRTU|nr:hypothetical protein AGR4A_Cc40037 [Agrobacterium tumefaciens str. B6]
MGFLFPQISLRLRQSDCEADTTGHKNEKHDQTPTLCPEPPDVDGRNRTDGRPMILCHVLFQILPSQLLFDLVLGSLVNLAPHNQPLKRAR